MPATVTTEDFEKLSFVMQQGIAQRLSEIASKKLRQDIHYQWCFAIVKMFKPRADQLVLMKFQAKTFKELNLSGVLGDKTSDIKHREVVRQLVKMFYNSLPDVQPSWILPDKKQLELYLRKEDF